jgi:hypothetical protein
MEFKGPEAVGGNEGGWMDGMDVVKDRPAKRWDWTVCYAMDTGQECERTKGAWETRAMLVVAQQTGRQEDGEEFFSALFLFFLSRSFVACSPWDLCYALIGRRRGVKLI